MSLDKDLINKLVKVTSRAAINCYQFLGKGNKKIADNPPKVNLNISNGISHVSNK